MLARRTGRATFVEVELMKEAIFGITILEAAIVYVCKVYGEEMGLIGLLRDGWRCKTRKEETVYVVWGGS
jgi:hypothetical protein